MGLFNFKEAMGDLFKEKKDLEAGMSKPINDFEAEADKFLDNAERRDQLNTAGGFASALGNQLMNNAQANLGFSPTGEWSFGNMGAADRRYELQNQFNKAADYMKNYQPSQTAAATKSNAPEGPSMYSKQIQDRSNGNKDLAKTIMKLMAGAA